MDNLDNIYAVYGVPEELGRRPLATISFLYRLFGPELMQLTMTGYTNQRILNHPPYRAWQQAGFDEWVHDVICLSEWTNETVAAIISKADTLRRIREAGYPFEVVAYAYRTGKPLSFVTDLLDQDIPPEYALALIAGDRS